MIERNQVITLKNRLSEPRKTIIAVTGPRQVGKTTLVRQALEQAQVPVFFQNADALVEEPNAWLEKVWNEARVGARGGTSVLVIDEVQKIEQWSEYVKKHWDADTASGTDVRVIVLGSSTVLLNTGLRESLAGRFERIRTMPWSFPEMREAFGWDLETYAVYGGYPGSASYISDHTRWMNYMMEAIIEPVIVKDVLQMQRIDKPGLLRQLMLTCAQMSSREVSFNKLMGTLRDAGNPGTLSNYLDILEEAGILSGLVKYQTSLMKRRSSPKLQVFANGIATACGTGWTRDMSASDRGRCYESAVGAHLRCACEGTDIKLSWWRNGNDEVDFVLSTNKKCLALEVATGPNHRLHGMNAFLKQFSDSKGLVIGEGGISFEQFFEMSPAELLDSV